MVDNVKQRFSNNIQILSLIILGIIFYGCISTDKVQKPKVSAFLQDYSILKKRHKNDDQRVYLNQTSDFGNYKKIMIDPVTIYAEYKSDIATLPRDDLQSLVNYLYATLRNQLTEDYEIVVNPGADVMHLRVAITEEKGSKRILETVSSKIPFGVALSSVKRVAMETHTTMRSVRVECEILDSLSGKQLFASVDSQVGKQIKEDGEKWKKWKDTKEGYNFWAEALKNRLAEFRKRKPAI